MEVENKITVEVAYALPDEQQIISLQVVPGTTAMEAVIQSGIAEHFTQIDLENDKMGLFGKALADPKTQVLSEWDRVEIYRPLLVDPKEVRKARAAKAREAKAKEAKQKG